MIITPEQSRTEHFQGTCYHPKNADGSPGGQHTSQSEFAEKSCRVFREPCSPKRPKQYLKLMMVIRKESVLCVSREMEPWHRNISKAYSGGQLTT